MSANPSNDTIEISALLSLIEQAEASLTEYELHKKSVMGFLHTEIEEQLHAHEHFTLECLIRIKQLRYDLQKAQALAAEYDDFTSGADIAVIYGPPEVM